MIKAILAVLTAVILSFVIALAGGKAPNSAGDLIARVTTSHINPVSVGLIAIAAFIVFTVFFPPKKGSAVKTGKRERRIYTDAARVRLGLFEEDDGLHVEPLHVREARERAADAEKAKLAANARFVSQAELAETIKREAAAATQRDALKKPQPEVRQAPAFLAYLAAHPPKKDRESGPSSDIQVAA